MTPDELIAKLNSAGASLDYVWQVNYLEYSPQLEQVVREHLLEVDDLDLADTLVRASNTFKKKLDSKTLLKLYDRWQATDEGIAEDFRGAIIQCLYKHPTAEVGRWAKCKILDKGIGGERYFMAELVARALPEEESTKILKEFYLEMPYAAVSALSIKGGRDAREFLANHSLVNNKDLKKDILKAINKIDKRIGIPT